MIAPPAWWPTALLRCCAVALVALLLGNAQARGVAVNGVVLDERSVAALEAGYRTRLAAGRYWYDRRSGLWGYELGPAQGQIAPRLALGGPLQARASVGPRAGITGVFVNGRELHPQELAYLRQLYGTVRPARYWLDQRGVGSYEGGPALFDLRERAVAQRGTAYTRRGPGGSSGSDGQCSYYNDPASGASVMTGRCR